MATSSLVKRGDANQTMHARLGGKQTVGVFSFYAEGHPFETGLLTGLVVNNLSLKAAALGPLQIHPQEHFRPVLRFRSACSRVDSTDGVALVVLAAQQHLSFRLIQVVLETLNKRAQFL